MKINEQYMVDRKGRQKSVVLSIADYRRLLKAMEELDDIQAYDEAKKSKETPILFKHSVK